MSEDWEFGTGIFGERHDHPYIQATHMDGTVVTVSMREGVGGTLTIHIERPSTAHVGVRTTLAAPETV
jgi:hypothetical protein